MEPNNQLPGVQPPTVQPGAQPEPPSPYGFILNAPHAPKKQLLKPNSLRSRLLLIVGGGIIIMLLIVGVSSLIKKSSQANRTALISLVAEQQEIIRVANLGITGSDDFLIQSRAETAALSVGSQQTSLTKYLKDRKVILTKIVLNAGLNTKTDEALKSATANNRFNEVFSQTLTDSLNLYAQNIKKSYANAEGPIIKAQLSESYKSTALLLK